MAGDGAIFRLTNTGDTEVSVGSGEKIEFNGGLVPDSKGNTQENRVLHDEDISFQPNPNRHLDQLQAGKLGTKEYILAGYIKNTGSTGQIVNFSNWMTQDKDNTDFPFGRFGVRLDDMSDDNVTPSSAVGLILYHEEHWRPDNDPEVIMFILKLYKNGTA